jgi:hypothetical protein
VTDVTTTPFGKCYFGNAKATTNIVDDMVIL